MAQVAAFRSKKTLRAVLRFNCFKDGLGHVIVAFPIKEQGAIEVTLRKVSDACALAVPLHVFLQLTITL